MHNKVFDKNFFEFDKYVVFDQHVENLSQVNKMFFQNIKENNNVVDINFDEFTISLK